MSEYKPFLILGGAMLTVGGFGYMVKMSIEENKARREAEIERLEQDGLELVVGQRYDFSPEKGEKSPSLMFLGKSKHGYGFKSCDERGSCSDVYLQRKGKVGIGTHKVHVAYVDHNRSILTFPGKR